ncbi:MAG TPA: PIN domain-containing protein [Candidatus Paceibacterota bacterium]|nr:PIN domain-containing protein [Verrucomicrobiota bacterium]HSA11848.1 PIN domain-containing protein [Candidatus Paceibacterota bacterium]
MIHLDTNFLVSALRAGSPEESQLNLWLSGNEILGTSAVAWAELFCGPLSARDELFARQIFSQVEVLSVIDAEAATQLFNKTGRRPRSLADCVIAAVAIRCGAKLATVNTSDFRPFVQHGLALA